MPRPALAILVGGHAEEFMGQRNFLELSAAPAGLTATGTICDWNTLALDACAAASPAHAARALAILHTSMYNAWAAYDDAARQTAHGVAIRLPRAERSAASKAAAMSHAAHLALTTLFPAQAGSFDARLAALRSSRGRRTATPCAVWRAASS
jgi:hypothetical protein